MSKKEIYICDVCGKESEKSFGSTDRVFNDDFTENWFPEVFGVKLELKQTEDVANACVCDDCFIEFLESALEQMREGQKEERHQAETTLPLKNEVVTESLGERLLMRYCKHELKPETRAVSICSIEAANKNLAKNSILFEVFYLVGKTIMQKEYAITTIAGWVNKKAPKRNTKSCNAFVKKYPIVEFCKTMEDVRTWWHRLKEYSQKNPKCNVRKENDK
jgi:hypothetical protein